MESISSLPACFERCTQVRIPNTLSYVFLRCLYFNVATGDEDALEPLRGRYDAQYYRLVRFYYECSNLRYLTSLISVPKLAPLPPNLLAGEEDKPSLPKRPTNEPEREPTPPPKSTIPDAEPINDFWSTEAKRQQEEYEAEQRRLQSQWEEQQRQQMLAPVSYTHLTLPTTPYV